MNGDYAGYDYTEEKFQRVEAELKQQLARGKPHGGEPERKLGGSDTSKRPKRDRHAHSTSAEGGQTWRPVDEPALRRLTNLDKIAAKPDAPVVLVDDTDAASAAARVFPEWIATASSGGAAKTDWRPLAGRRVLVWPGSSSPARKQVRGLAAALAQLDCQVSVLDVAALAALDPAGGEREPADECDAAAALADWKDAQALRKKVEDLAEPFDPGPAFVSVGLYSMNAKGLWKEVEHGRGRDKSSEDVWVSAPFEVLGLCRDPHGAGWGKYLRWRDVDGCEHMRPVGDADLHGDPGALCASLANEGLRIHRERQREFVGYLSAVRVERRLRAVKRTGWHENDRQLHFVLPDETIGPRGAERIILERTARGVVYDVRGSIQEWRDGVAKLAAGHVMPVLAISTALSGPLLHLAGMGGGGVHFWGLSSRGKTTLCQMAASVWGSGDEKGPYVQSWSTTANGLEGVAASATDTALILDEMGQADARHVWEALYSLANGVGKARAARDGAARERRTWRGQTISSGELSIEAKLAEDRGRKPRAGQLVRMLDISAERAFGAFDSNGPYRNAEELANGCKAAATAAYGTAGPEFVRRIIVNGVTGDDIRSRVKAFVEEAKLPIGADGQVIRAARRLGLITAAGELATRFGLTPWREGEASHAAIDALRQWIDRRGGAEPAEVRQAIRQIRLMIENHGDSRFDDLDNLGPDGKPKLDTYGRPVNVRPVDDRLGWRKGSGAEREWWIPPNTWRERFCNGLPEPQKVAGWLAEREMLRRQGGDTLQCKVYLGAGLRQNAYVLTSKILAGEDDDKAGGDDDER
jgi:putative DNA primase/helicase